MSMFRSVSAGLLGLGLVASGVMSGCAAPAPRPGELELVVEPTAAYAVVGRFQLTDIDSRGHVAQIDFDAATSRVRLPIPAGAYALTLNPGARLVCPEDVSTAPPGVARLVSSRPQRIAISPGGVSIARIALGPAPSAAHASDDPNPCRASGLPVADPMLSRR